MTTNIRPISRKGWQKSPESALTPLPPSVLDIVAGVGNPLNSFSPLGRVARIALAGVVAHVCDRCAILLEDGSLLLDPVAIVEVLGTGLVETLVGEAVKVNLPEVIAGAVRRRVLGPVDALAESVRAGDGIVLPFRATGSMVDVSKEYELVRARGGACCDRVDTIW